MLTLQMGLGTSISGFIYYLNSIDPDKEKDNKSDTVKVFTYHGSKGLEWPVVIMHGLGENVLTDADFTKKSFMKVCEVVMNDNATEEDPFAKEYYCTIFPSLLVHSIIILPQPCRTISTSWIYTRNSRNERNLKNVDCYMLE